MPRLNGDQLPVCVTGLSHGYDDVDYAILWNVVQEDIPNLIETVKQMLEEMGGDIA
jgi:uncharacterized protein with HEPN domain